MGQVVSHGQAAAKKWLGKVIVMRQAWQDGTYCRGRFYR